MKCDEDEKEWWKKETLQLYAVDEHEKKDNIFHLVCSFMEVANNKKRQKLPSMF